MKKLLTFCALLIAGGLSAQVSVDIWEMDAPEPDNYIEEAKLSYKPINDRWDSTSHIIFDTLESGQIVKEGYSETTFGWIINSKEFYSPLGTMDSSIVYDDSDTTKRPKEKVIYEYDNGSLSEKLYYKKSLSNNWYLNLREVFIYNENGRLVTIDQLKNGFNDRRLSYIFNTSGNLDSCKLSNRDGLLQPWEVYMVIKYNYTSSNKRSSIYSYWYTDGELYLDSKVEFSYDENLLSSKRYISRIDSELVPTFQFIYEWNESYSTIDTIKHCRETSNGDLICFNNYHFKYDEAQRLVSNTKYFVFEDSNTAQNRIQYKYADELPPLLIEEEKSQPAELVFPNPAKSRLNFQIDMEEPVNCTLYTLTGNMVLQERLTMANGNTIDVSGLNSGVYLYQLNSDDGYLKTGKFIKAR